MSNSNQSNSNRSLFTPIILKFLPLVFSTGVALGSGLGYGWANRPISKQLTNAEYQQIRPEMTITQVRAILGPGTETSKSESITTFIWIDPNHKDSFIKAKFKDNKLIEKEQSGL